MYDGALLTLDLHEQPDAVENPWRLLVQESEQKEYPLLAGTHIIEVYDQVSGELLILGEPGSGKTTMLLELARILLKRAEQDSIHPLPVVFNLSSWTEKQLLANWHVEELSTKYQVPRKVGRAWLEANELLLLLDGLDEVPQHSRSACVRAINTYRQEHNLMPIVLCCRKAEYQAQGTQLSLHGAVTVQPLTLQKIDNYLSQAGPELESARSSFREDQSLQELIRTPLMLSIYMLAYQGKDVDSLVAHLPPDMQQDHLFEVYVERMLKRRRASEYTPDQIKPWLTWLAQQMKRHSMTDFYIERIQMDWLPESRFRSLIPGITLGFVYGLFFGLVKWIDYGFVPGHDQNGRNFTPFRGLIDGLLIGLLNALVFGFLNGYVFGVLGKREKEREEGGLAKGSWPGKLIKVLELSPVYGLIMGVLNGLLIGVLVDWPAGLYNGLFIGVLYAVLGKLDPEIRPAEVVTWSWIVLRQNVFIFVTGGELIGLFYGLFTGLNALHQDRIHNAIGFLPYLIFGFSIGLVFGILVVLIRGFSHDKLNKSDILKPNQGIWNSARNSALLGLSCCLLFGLFFGVIYGVLLQRVFQAFEVPSLNYEHFFPTSSLIVGLANGLAVGAFIAVRSGGTACVQHLLLRTSLWRARCIPWKYTHFLDDMAERLLLSKVGGGYIYVHRLLLDHFASLETDRSSKEKKY